MIASSGHGTAVAPQGRSRPDRTDRGHERWALLSLCPGGRLNRAASAIYAGQDALWSPYNGVGGAAAAVGYAHEWGHHIQNVMGVPAPETPEESTALEAQADCIAGAWVHQSAQSG
jgi:Putative neutral zinc metallopeptidase